MYIMLVSLFPFVIIIECIKRINRINRFKRFKRFKGIRKRGEACQGGGAAPKQPAGPRFERPARAV